MSDSKAAEVPSGATRLYVEEALRSFHQSMHEQDYAEALNWAQHAQLIAIAIDADGDIQPMRDAYARVILACCLESEELTITRSGGIYGAHTLLLDNICRASSLLTAAIARKEKEIPLIISMGVGRVATELSDRIRPLIDNIAPRSPRQMEEFLTGIRKIADETRKLTKADVSFSEGDRLSIASTALSNARFGLTMFLTEWKLAGFYVSQARRLVQGLPGDHAFKVALAQLDQCSEDIAVKMNRRFTKRTLRKVENLLRDRLDDVCA